MCSSQRGPQHHIKVSNSVYVTCPGRWDPVLTEYCSWAHAAMPAAVNSSARQRLAHPTYGQSGTPRYGMCCLQNENTYHGLWFVPIQNARVCLLLWREYPDMFLTTGAPKSLLEWHVSECSQGHSPVLWRTSVSTSSPCSFCQISLMSLAKWIRVIFCGISKNLDLYRPYYGRVGLSRKP